MFKDYYSARDVQVILLIVMSGVILLSWAETRKRFEKYHRLIHNMLCLWCVVVLVYSIVLGRLP